MSRQKKKRQGATRRVWEPLQVAAVRDAQVYIDMGLDPPSIAYVNNLYSVFVRNLGDGAKWISLHRHDRAAVRDWRHLQQIKNEVGGEESTAIEIFPPESMLVDSSNEYHLWVMPFGAEIPYTFKGERFVLAPHELERHLGGPTKARQRPWDPGLTTGLGEREPRLA